MRCLTNARRNTSACAMSQLLGSKKDAAPAFPPLQHTLRKRTSSQEVERPDWGMSGIHAAFPMPCSVNVRGKWALCHEYRRSKRRCATVLEMKEGPSGSAIRGRSQVTASGCGQKPWS